MGSHVGAAAMTPSSFLHGDVNRSPPIPVWSFSSGSASASSWRSNQDVSGGSIIAIPTTMRKPRLPPAKSWNRPSPLIFTEPKFRLAVFQKTGRSKIPQNRPVRPNKMPVHLHRRHGKKRTARQTSPCATPDKSTSPSPKQQTPSSSPATMAQTGGGGGVLDLERHFAFYGAYHSNPVNVFIHALFVWPIFLTALLLLHLTAPSLHAAAVGAAVYGAFYVSLDRRSGAVAAVLCFLCWAASAALAARLGYSVGCKVVLVAQLFCWTMQFIGHGVFEKRAPALLDNLVQAFLMAPYFVLLEILHKFSGYEPYPGFHANVQKLIDAKRKEWEDKKAKKRT